MIYERSVTPTQSQHFLIPIVKSSSNDAAKILGNGDDRWRERKTLLGSPSLSKFITHRQFAEIKGHVKRPG